MLDIATRFLTTLQERLNPLRDDTVAQGDYKIDDIRQAMLDCLDEYSAEHAPHIEKRILGATSLSALWFLRPELLTVVSLRAGEDAAHRMLADISAMFDGLLPKSMNTRPLMAQR